MVWLKSLRHRARVAGSLSLADWLALLESWWLMLFFAVALRWMSYERLAGLIGSPGYGLQPESDQVRLAERLNRMVVLASRLSLPPATCLVRAAALSWMLKGRDIPSRLCIGANRSADSIHAHAWVEVQDRAIGEPAEARGKFHLLASSRDPLLRDAIK